MERINGFINLNKILNEIGITNFNDLKTSPKINPILINTDSAYNIMHFSFEYKGITYFYKYKSFIPVYNELIAEELAKDFDIPCISYDLAVLNKNEGIISKNFKQPGYNYITGYQILEEAFSTKDLFDDERYNNLESIWEALEYRYKSTPNKKEIISHLMKRVTDIFIFDIICGLTDRHSSNWGIMEKGETIDIMPLFDNERITDVSIDDYTSLLVSNSEEEYLDDNFWNTLKRFQKKI